MQKHWALLLLVIILVTALFLRVKQFLYPEEAMTPVNELIATSTDSTASTSTYPEVVTPAPGENAVMTTTVNDIVPVVVSSSVSSTVKTRDYISEEVVFSSTSIRVMLANTPELRFQGLSGKKNLGIYGGMLFDFGNPGYYGMVMRGMTFPLDFIWINGLTVVDTDENAPLEPDKDEADFTIYMSKTMADKVIEVPAGFVAKNHIQVGEEVKILK